MPAMGVAVNVAGIKLSFGILLDIKSPYLLSADGALTADAGFDAVLDFSSSLQFGTLYPKPVWNYSAAVSALNLHRPVINANANLQVQTGLEARLRATLVSESILSASAAASGNLDLTASFRNPPFPAKSSPTNSTCTKPHRTEWGLDFFVVGSGQVNAGTWNKGIPSSPRPLFPQRLREPASDLHAPPQQTHPLHIESPSKEYFRKNLATGCLLPVN